MRRKAIAVLFVGSLVLAANRPALGTEPAASSDEELAKKLANPVASLISVPLQNNWDFGMAPDDDGWRYTFNLQPVVPISITENWNLISRTILPVIYQDEVVPGKGDQFGLGDTLQSFFFSPKAPGPLGSIWGVGPALLLPTATDTYLKSEKWAAGPTGVVLRQQGPWTYGILTNHLWSYAGEDDRRDIDRTFLQPFVNYTTPRATSFVVNTESTYDWERDHWTIPIHFGPFQMFKIGTQRIQVGLQGRWYADRPSGGPDWGFRIPVTLLFPK